MKTIIQTPGFKASQKLLLFLDEKLAKLDVPNSTVEEARVCLRLDKSDSKENKFCEIRLVVSGNDLFASRQTESFEESVTKTVAAIKHQLAKAKTEREKQRTL